MFKVCKTNLNYLLFNLTYMFHILFVTRKHQLLKVNISVLLYTDIKIILLMLKHRVQIILH